ncbi:DnaD domain protein [Pediococcus cellicola]|uniref:DnaD domain protein n=1 Tax=Pediococcus cellicola TaxID=319652 RepID=UPI0009F8AA0D|nr:DnaD domain protein [Pediococcus cellicola]GEL14366.1 DNA replication protein DnaD [Pediococcus cellicola]
MDEFMRSYLKAGNTVVSNYLLSNFHRVGLTNDELIIYLIIEKQREQGDRFPSSKLIAEETGLSESKVYELLHEMIQNNLMEIKTVKHADGKSYDQYSFERLFEKLLQSANHEVVKQQQTNEKMDRETIFAQIESEFGRPLSPIEYETINQWLNDDHYAPEMISLALKEAVLSQAYSLRYMDRILLNWEKKHLTSVSQVQKEEERQRNNGLDPSRHDRRNQNGEKADLTGPKIPIYKISDQ